MSLTPFFRLPYLFVRSTCSRFRSKSFRSPLKWDGKRTCGHSKEKKFDQSYIIVSTMAGAMYNKIMSIQVVRTRKLGEIEHVRSDFGRIIFNNNLCKKTILKTLCYNQACMRTPF